MRTIRACDQGTAFATALLAGDKAGAVDSTDAQVMAAFSPRLVWEGAQKAGLTTLELNALCAKKDLAALDDLQWS